MKQGSAKSIYGIVSGASVVLVFLAARPASADVTAADLKSVYGAQLQVLGEVQTVDLAKGIIVVAGQHIATSQETAFSFGNVPATDSGTSLRAIHQGDVLAVSGPVDRPAVSIDRLNEAYIPGATTIFVKGKISALNGSIGIARIDELQVDFTPAMSDLKFTAVVPGQIVEAVGIQPLANGPLIAYTLSATSAIRD